MSSTYTPYLGLRKPEHRDPETYDAWDIVLNGNADIIDLAFGERSYSSKAVLGTISVNYPSGIQNVDSHSLSLNKIAERLKEISDLTPTSTQKTALGGGGNRYVVLTDVRGNKTLILFPEFAGGILTATGTGTLTVDNETVSNYMHNFYKWLGSGGTIQSRDIFVQVKIPDGKVAWQATALKIAIATEDTDTDECSIGVTFQRDGYAAGALLDDQVSDTDEIWKNISILSNDPVISTLVAGDILNIQITMNSKSKYVKIGAITLQYIGF